MSTDDPRSPRRRRRPVSEVSNSPAPQSQPFNPLSLEALQRILREQLECQPRVRLPLTSFSGPGVYALYYIGSSFEPYLPLARTDVPIYVGKAAAGSSSYGDPADQTETALFKRVGEHTRSLEQASDNLATDDFEVRTLVVDDAWIVLAERALLRAYRPVLWNTVMPGFGANPSGGDRTNARSVWDTVHPGRTRAGRLCNRSYTLDEMLQRIDLAVRFSLMPEGPERATKVNQFRKASVGKIWKTDKRDGVRVLDANRFHAEMTRLNLTVPSGVRVTEDPATTADVGDHHEPDE
jgi:hypothetical protein